MERNLKSDRLFERLAGFICRRAIWILLAIILLTLISLVSLSRIEYQFDVVPLMQREFPEAEDFIRLRERYHSAEPILILVSLPENDSFRNPERLSQLIGYRDALSQVDLVSDVACFVPESLPGTPVELSAGNIHLVPAFLRDRLFDSPLSNILLSENSQHTMLIAIPELDDVPREMIENLSSLPPPPGTERYIAGNPIISATVKQASTGVVTFIPLLVIVVTILVFFLAIGDLRLSIIAVFPAIIASIWQMSLFVITGIEVTIWTAVAPVFVMVLGSADGLHFVTHYQRIYYHGISSFELVARILKRVGIPIILTTISTSAGLFSLLATGILPTQQLGGSTGTGILLAGLVSLVGLPAIVSLLPVRSEGKSRFLATQPLITHLQTLAGRRSVATVFSVSILLIGIMTIPRIESQTGLLFYFKKNAEIRRAFARIDQVFGGSTSLVGEFARESGSSTGAGLQAMADVSRQMEQLSGIRRVISLADLRPYLDQPSLEQIMDGGELPGFGRLASPEGFKFLTFVDDYTDSDIMEWRSFATENDLIATLTGAPLLFPVILSAVALLALISLGGIDLNLSNAIMASIVVGIGVDYSIHFLAAVDHHRNGGPGYITRAIGEAGLPIIANAIGIAIGFSTLYLSPLLPYVHIASIMWVTMLVAAFSALTVIPLCFPKDAFSGPEPVIPGSHNAGQTP